MVFTIGPARTKKDIAKAKAEIPGNKKNYAFTGSGRDHTIRSYEFFTAREVASAWDAGRKRTERDALLTCYVAS
jgi:hypothetical protein